MLLCCPQSRQKHARVFVLYAVQHVCCNCTHVHCHLGGVHARRSDVVTAVHLMQHVCPSGISAGNGASHRWVQLWLHVNLVLTELHVRGQPHESCTVILVLVPCLLGTT